MKYYLVVGEKSGDMHAAKLIESLLKIDKNATFRYRGGEGMEAVAGNCFRHYQDHAYMGFWEVLKNFRKILSDIKTCKQDIVNFAPDCLILVDFPGYNLRLLKWAKKNNIKTVYYILPKVWAWKEKRIKIIKKADLCLSILPFEESYFKKKGLKVNYVGNPIFEQYQDFIAQGAPEKLPFEKTKKKVVALFPGSRRQELKYHLPVFNQLLATYNHVQWVIAGNINIEKGFYKKYIASDCPILFDQSYNILLHSDVGIICSGSSNLEAAFFSLPQIVIYKSSWINIRIARCLIKIPYISLVNLIMNRPIVPELIAKDCRAKKIKHQLDLLSGKGDGKKNMEESYTLLKQKIGNKIASLEAAKSIFAISSIK